MTHEIVSVLCGGPGTVVPQQKLSEMGPLDHCITLVHNSSNLWSPCQAYQAVLETTKADVQLLIHDDVTIHDADWLERVLHFFCSCGCHCNTMMPYITPCLHCTPKGCAGMRFGETGQVVAVGLGGATGLGNRDLYRKSYSIWNLARRGYASNQDDAETHGERFTGTRRCAVIEQFFMAIRTDWLRTRRTLKPHRNGIDKDGRMDYELGWPTAHLTHHLLDAWLACEAARDGKEIWQVGVSCAHHGGQSSTSDKYAKAQWLIGGSMASDHQIPHRWIYDTYRDCLPLEVTP